MFLFPSLFSLGAIGLSGGEVWADFSFLGNYCVSNLSNASSLVTLHTVTKCLLTEVDVLQVHRILVLKITEE